MVKILTRARTIKAYSNTKNLASVAFQCDGSALAVDGDERIGTIDQGIDMPLEDAQQIVIGKEYKITVEPID